MNIRSRLTIQFLSVGGAIILFAFLAVYVASSEFRRDSFNKRLENRANRTARLLIEVEGIDLSLMQRIDSNNPIMLPREKIVIYTGENDTLYNSNTRYRHSITTSALDQIRNQRRLTWRQEELEVLGTMYNSGGRDYVIIASAYDEDGRGQLKTLGTILLIVSIGSLILIAIAGWFLAGRALAPISTIIDRVGEVTASSLSLRIDEGNGTDEIAKLAMTFNNMLNRIEEAFKMQKSFISNASHEIRNPFTSIYGQLQVLMMRSRTIEEYERSINSVLEDMRDLTNLVNSLLLLAQTQSDVSSVRFESVRLDEVLMMAAASTQNENPAYRVKVNIDNEGPQTGMGMIISGNEYLVKTVIINLIGNACKYSSQHSVDVNIYSTSDTVTIVFRDQGPGIPAQDLKKIFEPFYRGTNSITIQGHGIGLSLVKRIVDSHGGRIKIDSDIAKGTVVTVNFPRNRKNTQSA